MKYIFMEQAYLTRLKRSSIFFFFFYLQAPIYHSTENL